jgi:hypothetical protein
LDRRIGAIEHTHVYDNRNERLKHIATEAAIAIAQKKKVLRDMVLVDIDKRIHHIVDSKPYSIVHNRKASITSYIPVNNAVESKSHHKPTQKEVENIPKGIIGDIKRSFASRKQDEPVPVKREEELPSYTKSAQKEIENIPKGIIGDLKRAFSVRRHDEQGSVKKGEETSFKVDETSTIEPKRVVVNEPKEMIEELKRSLASRTQEKTENIVSNVEPSQMEESARLLDFESAAKLRDQIKE